MALNGEFVELAELLNCNGVPDSSEFRTYVDSEGNLAVKCVRQKKSISTSFKWIEAWSLYEMLMCTTYGVQLFQQMLLYRLFILGLFHKYKIAYVLTYDARHRQALGAKRSLNFNCLNPELYVMTFDSESIKSVPRCSKCSSTDHSYSQCPFRVAGQASGDLPRNRRPDERSGGDRATLAIRMIS